MIATQTEGVELRRVASVRRVLGLAIDVINEQTLAVLSADHRSRPARVEWSDRGDMIVTMPAVLTPRRMRLVVGR